MTRADWEAWLEEDEPGCRAYFARIWAESLETLERADFLPRAQAVASLKKLPADLQKRAVSGDLRRARSAVPTRLIPIYQLGRNPRRTNRKQKCG
jgi:hypothetical protein